MFTQATIRILTRSISRQHRTVPGKQMEMDPEKKDTVVDTNGMDTVVSVENDEHGTSQSSDDDPPMCLVYVLFTALRPLKWFSRFIGFAPQIGPECATSRPVRVFTTIMGCIVGTLVMLANVDLSIQLVTGAINGDRMPYVMYKAASLSTTLLALYSFVWALSFYSKRRCERVMALMAGAKELLADKERTCKILCPNAEGLKAGLKKEVRCIRWHVKIHILTFVLPTLAVLLFVVLWYCGVFGTKFDTWSAYVRPLQSLAATASICNAQAFMNILTLVGRLAVRAFTLKIASLERLDHDDKHEEIRVVRRQHQILVELVAGLDRTICHIYLVYNIFYVVIVVLNLGALVTGWNDVQLITGEHVCMIAIQCGFGTVIFVVSNLSPILLNELLFKCTDTVTCAWRRLQNNKESDYCKMDAVDREFGYLLTNVVNTTIGITAGNFYFITRASCTTIVSAILTYFIMILQFVLSAPAPQNCMNSTEHSHL